MLKKLFSYTFSTLVISLAAFPVWIWAWFFAGDYFTTVACLIIAASATLLNYSLLNMMLQVKSQLEIDKFLKDMAKASKDENKDS
jgi:hypothetical protein